MTMDSFLLKGTVTGIPFLQFHPATRFSVAILKYLALKYKIPDHWYPSDIKKQARIDEYMNWQHLNLRAQGSQYFLTRVRWLRLLIVRDSSGNK